MKNTKNKRLFANAQKVIPGGVNSPVRAFNAVDASPIFIEKAKGQYLYDALRFLRGPRQNHPVRDCPLQGVAIALIGGPQVRRTHHALNSYDGL